MIRARGLSRTFREKGRGNGRTNAVVGVDIDVRPGEIVGFLGPNGAGKSTTFRMLGTLLRPTSGEATVAGRDLLRDPAGVRRRIGYVAQGNGASADQTVLREVVFQGRAYGLSKQDSSLRAMELLGQLDLGDQERRLVKTLSGGQRRRLDIALGLVHRPALVFLDEPTTGLDPQTRANLWDHIRALRATYGMTVFLTTHYLDEADALADRLLIIDNGRIVAEGTSAELKARVASDRIVIDIAGRSPHMDVLATIPSRPPELAIAQIVGRLSGAHDVSVEGGSVSFRVPHGWTVLPDLQHQLDVARIATNSVQLVGQVTEPTLDDVFLELTGRSLRERNN